MRSLTAAVSLILLAAAPAWAQDHGGKIDWVRDPDFGLAKAQMEGRAALVYFTADW